MKSNRIVAGIAGVFLFLSIVLTFVWFLSPDNSNQSKEITFSEVVNKVEKREVKEITFKKNSQVELVDLKKNKFYSSIGSDPTRESLLATIKEYNRVNSSAPITFSEEPSSSGWGWIVLINASPLIILFFIMWGITLAVIVYAVRTLSRNKG